MVWQYVPFWDGEEFVVKELYNIDGKQGTTVDAISPSGETIESLIDDLKYMLSEIKGSPVYFKEVDGELVAVMKEGG